MTITPDFAAAGAPLSFVPAQFVQNLHMRFHAFDEAQTDFSTLASDIDALPFQPRDRHFRQSLRPLYRSFLKAAVDSTLFIAFCAKNIKFMKMATDRIKAQMERELGLHASTFSDPAHLNREMDYFRDQMFTRVDGIYAMMSAETPGVRMARYHGDPFSATFLTERRLRRADFNDWLEFNFLTRNRMPLGLYPVSDYVAAHINGNARSTHRGNDIIARLRANDPETKLNANFPGLSLDAEPKTQAQLARARQGIAAHAFHQPDITARVIETGGKTRRGKTGGAGPRAPRPLG